MTAVANPAATVARAPVARRASIIGNVNVMASATLAYSGHALRMMMPATLTMITHTASPATTPRVDLAISFLPNDRRRIRPEEAPRPSDRPERILGRVVATGLGKIGHAAGRQMAWCRSRESRQVQRQVGLIEVPSLGCERRGRPG